MVDRTAEARSAQATAEQRAAELAIINSIQQGMAGELDFQAIVDLVGDKLREVFASQDLYIGLLDADGKTMRMPYSVEHGVRMAQQSVRAERGARVVPRDPHRTDARRTQRRRLRGARR